MAPPGHVPIGGDALLPAISVSTDLATGRCLSCHTFGDLSAMVPSTDAFSIGLVQLWDLTPLSEHEAGEDVPWLCRDTFKQWFCLSLRIE